MTIVDADTGAVVGRQVMEPLTGDQRADLRASIEKHGVLEPIVVDQNGEIIDGHTRWSISDELGTDCPSTTVHVDDEAHALELAATLNLARRHLPEQDRRERVRKLRELGMSSRQIADHVGVSHETARKDIKCQSDVTLDDPPETVTGSDGREQAATHLKWDDDLMESIQERLNAGETQVAIAEEMGVAANSISSALARWRDRKIMPVGLKDRTPAGARLREQRVRELAEDGHSSRQISEALDITREAVKDIAARIGIEITADAVVGKTRHHDPDRIASEVAISLDGAASSVELIDYERLSPDVAREWATSISDSLRTLGKFRKHLQEVANDQE